MHGQLHTDLVINGIKRVLESKPEDIPIEIKANALALTLNLHKHKTDEFRQMLKDMNVQDTLDNVKEVDTKLADLKEFDIICDFLKK